MKLRAACQQDSIEQRGALNYGIVRSSQAQDPLQLTVEECHASASPLAASQTWSQPHGNGGPLVHLATGKCVTVAGRLHNLELQPCQIDEPAQNFTFPPPATLGQSGPSGQSSAKPPPETPRKGTLEGNPYQMKDSGINGGGLLFRVLQGGNGGGVLFRGEG